MPPDELRQRLAAAQAELARALLAGEAPPRGFAPDRLRVAAAALLAKRRRLVQRHQPDLADQLGNRFRPLFDAWARAHPRQDGDGRPCDAQAFAVWLADQGQLTGRRPRLRRWLGRAARR